MGHVIPTVFAHSPAEFKKRFARLVKIAPVIQIDFMDGVFVPTKSMPLSAVPDLRKYKATFEAHLMVAKPEEWIATCKTKGFRKVIVHLEALKDKERGLDLFHRIQTRGIMPMLAINPETSMEELEPFFQNIQQILVMGVQPGKEHQELDANAVRRVATLKKRYNNLWVQVDGGVNDRTIEALAKAGADAVNSGGFIADAAKPREALELLEKKFREGKR